MQQSPSISVRPRLAGAIALIAAAAAVLALLAATSSTAVAAGNPACQTRGLVVWLDTNGNGTAGSIFYTLNFTNQSGHKCTLRGYPGVSAINLKGGRVGKPASRDNATKVKTITLRNNATATSVLRIVDNGAISNCGRVNAAGLRVFPPNQRASKTVPFPFGACSRTSVLSVRAIK
ncbi:MAG TPA: DUF4232 domain-containing protein [Solirubrobacteraceae bacterium]|jgi:hypothetical protein